MRLPACCPNCGLIFGSGITIDGGIGVFGRSAVADNVFFYDCPRDDTPSPTIGGMFQMLGDMLVALQTNQLNWEILRTYQAQLDGVARGDLFSGRAVRNVRQAHPDQPTASSRFGEWLTHGISIATFLVSVASLCLAELDRRSNEPLRIIIERCYEGALRECEGPFAPDISSEDERPLMDEEADRKPDHLRMPKSEADSRGEKQDQADKSWSNPGTDV